MGIIIENMEANNSSNKHQQTITNKKGRCKLVSAVFNELIIQKINLCRFWRPGAAK